MHNSGIIRRIDDLGRVVIPKGIRKSLRIKNGDNLEISYSNDYIIIKKYDQLSKFNDVYIGIINSFYKFLKKNILFCNNDVFIYGMGPTSKSVVEKKISDDIKEYIGKRCDNTINKNILLTNNINYDGPFFITPLMVDGNTVGALILLDEDITKSDITIIHMMASFICGYIE